MRDYEKDWKEFWEPLVTKDGKLDLEQVKKELCDFLHMIEEVPKVYCAITDNMLSYPTYYADQVLQVHGEQLDRLREEWIKENDAAVELRTENQDLHDKYAYVMELISTSRCYNDHEGRQCVMVREENDWCQICKMQMAVVNMVNRVHK